jgi:solute carrier family 25 S-adenosylmethionine transporter 26
MRRTPIALMLLVAALPLVAARSVEAPHHLTAARAADVKPLGAWKSQMLFNERLIAGSAARGVAQTVLHPIDVVRTRLQAKGVSVAFTPRTLSKGITPQFWLAFPAGALQFAAYEFAKDAFAKANMAGALPEMVSGALGALGASVIRVPQEVLKQRVQADIYPNALKGAGMLLRADGPAGFYKGYFATISRDVPWNALSFMFFAQAKTLFASVVGRAPATDENLALGALSGMAAAVIMTPGARRARHTRAWLLARAPHACPFYRSLLLTTHGAPRGTQSTLSKHAS